jgi:hypothetical protein
MMIRTAQEAPHKRDQEHGVIRTREREKSTKQKDERDVMSNVRSRRRLIGYY